jgi:hypothetical protein
MIVGTPYLINTERQMSTIFHAGLYLGDLPVDNLISNTMVKKVLTKHILFL